MITVEIVYCLLIATYVDDFVLHMWMILCTKSMAAAVASMLTFHVSHNYSTCQLHTVRAKKKFPLRCRSTVEACTVLLR